MRYFAAVFLALLTLIAALPAQENMGRGRISGDVVDEIGAAVPSALVVVRSLQGSARLESKTDKRGHFVVAGLGSGAWQVTVSKDGYISANIEMRVSQLKTNPAISLTLKKASGVEAVQADEQGRALLEQGNALLEAEKYDEALAAYEEFALKFPEVYGVRINIGMTFMKKGDLDQAEAEFRDVLDKSSQDPGDAEKKKDTSLRALSGLGEIAMKRGDLTAAQDSFRRALEISPEDPAAAYNVGEIFFSNQKIDEAITYFELAAKIKKDWPKPYRRLGLVYLNKGDFDKALENLRKFIELDPESPDAATVKATIAAVEKLKK